MLLIEHIDKRLEQHSAVFFSSVIILNVCESKVIIKMRCFPDNVLLNRCLCLYVMCLVCFSDKYICIMPKI